MDKKILITGAAGFIGSHVIRLFVTKYPNYMCYNLDALTYAGNLENLKDICDLPNYQFIKGDITDTEFIENLFQEYQFDGVIHLAAESHVDRSITDPLAFIRTNVMGTANLLNAARNLWKGNYEGKRFYHVSTDEVYGSLGKEGYFTEKTAYDPRSPYSASKASSDHFVRAYFHTYGLPVVTLRSEALNTALPATRISAPAATAEEAFLALIPPSTSTSTLRPRRLISSLIFVTFSSVSGIRACPPYPGSTVMTRTISHFSSKGYIASGGVAGLMEIAERTPLDLIRSRSAAESSQAS